MRLLKWIWNPLKVTGAPIHLALLLVTVTFCYSAFSGRAIYNLGSTVYEAMTGNLSIASQHATEIADLDGQLDVEKQTNDKLGSELVLEKLISQELRKELDSVKRQSVNVEIMESCVTSIKGKKHNLKYNAKDELLQKGYNREFREFVFGSRGEIDCPAYVTFRKFAPELTNVQKDPFCLNYDKEKETYNGISEGERDAFLVCKTPKTVCTRVNATKEDALAFSGLDATTTVGMETALSTVDVTVVTHRSGAFIITGPSGYLVETLGTISVTTAEFLTAPLSVTDGVVTLVGIGASVYLCS